MKPHGGGGCRTKNNVFLLFLLLLMGDYRRVYFSQRRQIQQHAPPPQHSFVQGFGGGCCSSPMTTTTRRRRLIQINRRRNDRKPFTVSLSSSSSTYYWEADGNGVDNDFRLLDQSIQRSTAPSRFLFHQRNNALQAMAQQRLPLAETLRKQTAPIVLTTGVLLWGLQNTWWPSHWVLLRLWRTLATVYVTSVVILPPVVLSIWHTRINQRRRRSHPSETVETKQCSGSVESNFYDETSRLPAPPFLLLTEQWLSAVVPAVATLTCGLTSVRCLVTAGSLAATHRYPLVRHHCTAAPRPRTLIQTLLEMALARLDSMSTRLVWATDCAILLRCLPAVVAWSTWGGCTASVLVLARFPQACLGVRRYVEKWGLRLAQLVSLLALFRWIRLNDGWRYLIACVPLIQGYEVVPFITKFSLKSLSRNTTATILHVLKVVRLAAAGIIPICHIAAFFGVVRVVHTHDLSLATDPSTFTREHDKSDRFQWRIKLQWQEPERIWDSWQRTKRRLLERLFVDGSVRGQLENLKRKAFSLREEDTVWYRLKREGFQASSDREEGKKRAMKTHAEWYQAQYEGNDILDPLGVAVYRVFGVGLGFNFDHMSNATGSATDIPESRRLQARAAKSAIKRVQEIYAQNEVIVAGVHPNEKDAKRIELKKVADAEVERLANMLTNLIPTDGALGSTLGGDVEQHMFHSSERSSRSKVVDQLLRYNEKDDEVDYLDPNRYRQNRTSQVDPVGLEDDRDFVEVWAQQQARQSGGEPDDENSTIVLA